MEHFVIIVNEFQPLTIITKLSILDVAAVLDLPLERRENRTALVSQSYMSRNITTIVKSLFKI